MAYATYTYYTDTFKGNVVPSSEFDRAIARAGSYLDFISEGAVASIATTEPVKLASCAIAEIIYSAEGTEGKTSESGIGYSVNYDKVEVNRLKFQKAKEYLWNSDVLYRGF